MYGYKDGEIDINENTYLTLGEYGKTGVFIMDIQENDGFVKIITEISV